MFLIYTLLKEKIAENTNSVTFSLHYQLLIAGFPRNNCSGGFETLTEMPLNSWCYLHKTVDYFI